MRHLTTIIIGGGLSGLSVAHRIIEDQPDHNFCLLEQKSRTGGVIWSHKEQGILAEPGPHGFLDNCRESRKLLEETKLDKICVRASLQQFVRYVYHEKKLKMIAQSPARILLAPLISPAAKIGVLRDLWKPPLTGEPTIAEWTRHRFGPALLPYVDAAVTGTYAGDIEKLTIDSVMPGIRAIERQYGSVLRGLIAKRRGVKNSRRKSPGLPAMTSFPGGMQQLVERLAARLTEGDNLVVNSPVTQIIKTESGWQVMTTAETLTADNLVLAVPINTSLELLAAIATPPLSRLPEAAIANVAVTFSEHVPLPKGFGFLVPEQENKFILGALFSSNMFAARAPGNTQLLEIMVGGRRHPQRLELPEQELIDRAVADVRQILKIDEQPLFARKLPSPGSFPQLERGYPALLEWKNRLEATTPGLHICGFGWGGIGINDMIKGSFRVAANLLAGNSDQQEPEIKPVYF
ncbi:MAG: protoporphyrinogen oxidase [Deltaproteobacteria bacterium]|nr:MAG: protoporphyrinogen oxidase [Deltaproteobacteria bacterium]